MMTIPRGVPRSLTVAVSGSRTYSDVSRANQILDDVHKQRWIKLLIEGACPHESETDEPDGGLDEIARLWAKRNEVNSLSVPPKSKRIPWPGCGPARNREMAHFNPQVWILFPGGSGTQSAREIAMEFHITRLELTDEEYSWIEHRSR
jgi:hypothetical protein